MNRAASLTALELDPALAAGLGRRLRGTGVRVVRGDGAALPFRDGSFDTVAVLTMLLRFRLYHLADTMVVVDPAGLPDRLRAAGFTEVSVTTRARRLRFQARRAPHPTA